LLIDPGTSNAQRTLEWAVIGVLALSAALVLAQVGSDPDIWGRVAYGRLAFEQGVLFPTVDPYSYTAAGAPWHDHEYGFSWLAFGAHWAGGWPGVRLLGLLLFTVTLGLCLGPSFALGQGTSGRLVLYALAILALGPGFQGPRAQAVSFVLFAWLCFCLWRSSGAGPGWILLGALPMPLWANLHGGVLAGIGVLGVWSALRLRQALLARDLRMALALGGAGLWALGSLWLTPWGAQYPAFLLRSATMSRQFVPEWDAPDLLGAQGLLALLFVGVALFAGVRQRRLRPEWAVLAVVALAALRHQRHLPFLAIATLVFAMPTVFAFLAERRKAALPAGAGRVLGVLAGVLAAVSLGLAVAVGRAVLAPAPAEPHFPSRALQELVRRGEGGGLLVDFEWAQYVLFHGPQGVRLAFDGRYEAVYPPEVIAAFMAWNYGQPGWKALPQDPRTRLALVAAQSSRARRLEGLAGWRKVYSDEVAALFIKEAG
jgi:hypothetical protein